MLTVLLLSSYKLCSGAIFLQVMKLLEMPQTFKQWPHHSELPWSRLQLFLHVQANQANHLTCLLLMMMAMRWTIALWVEEPHLCETSHARGFPNV